jgi:Domain of unknown function (DUF4157)
MGHRAPTSAASPKPARPAPKHPTVPGPAKAERTTARHWPLTVGAVAPPAGSPASVSPTAAAAPTDPAALRTALGAGRPLEGGHRARMETALGGDLSGVRVHTEPYAAALATRLDATAFTVGEHVGFASGAFRPGTLVGDAILAHELTHVRQQRFGTFAGNGPSAAAGAPHEAVADRSALAALTGLWPDVRSVLGRRSPPAPAGGGLMLQRCTGDPRLICATVQEWLMAFQGTTTPGKRNERPPP